MAVGSTVTAAVCSANEPTKHPDISNLLLAKEHKTVI